MSVRRLLASGMISGMCLSLLVGTAEAATFNFSFDATPNDDVTPPLVGSGTFNFDGPANVGTFGLASLSNYSFSFTFGSATFTNADIVTPVANVLVQVQQSGSDLIVNFGGAGGGPFGGSLDFINGPSNLSFQPNFGSLYFENGAFGTYRGVAAAVPEPATWAMMLCGFGLVGAASRQRSRTSVTYA